MSHHDVLAALVKDTSVILCKFLNIYRLFANYNNLIILIILGEHSNTERGYLSEILKPKLEQLFKDDDEKDVIDVVVSNVDKDPLEIV